MEHVRAALYLDFDNVFGGLYKLDPDVAIDFANAPGAWLRRLATTLTPAPRRWLVLRCYLNPAGLVYHPDQTGETQRLFFSRYRPSFVRAGFEVIDCPRYSGTKNGADIRIVVDAIDALAADTRYDEFVIASGDSDMTPLLQRLRRSDRRTMIVLPADAAEAFTVIADRVLDSQQLLALIQGEPVDFDDEADGPPGADVGGDTALAGQSEGYEEFRSVVTGEFAETSEPLNMASLASRLRTRFGRAIDDSNWFGYGSFARAVESLGLSNLRMSQHLLWDGSRHPTPEATVAAAQRVPLPEPVERLADQVRLPRLPRSWWPEMYRKLAEYALSHRFNLTECTSWVRDELRDQGLPVSRGNVAFVVRGTSFGGCPLHRQPAPTAAEIGAAFTANVLSRADALDPAFSEDEVAAARAWLSAAPDAAAADGPLTDPAGSAADPAGPVAESDGAAGASGTSHAPW